MYNEDKLLIIVTKKKSQNSPTFLFSRRLKKSLTKITIMTTKKFKYKSIFSGLKIYIFDKLRLSINLRNLKYFNNWLLNIINMEKTNVSDS